jgi:tetratricopeptide (TPR) repeat protein
MVGKGRGQIEGRLRRLLSLGREHYRAGDYDDAERYLTEAVGQQVRFADVFNMLGVIHYSRERFGDAERCFETALKINPRYTEAALNLAVIYNDSGKYAQARAVYECALAYGEDAPRGIDPFARGKIANMHADLGAVYCASGLYAEAIGEFDKALELCPSFVDIRTRLGHVYREVGKPRAAIAEFERALREQPDFSPARVALGVTLYSLGRSAAAIAQWRQVLAADPQNQLAAVYLRMAEGTHPPQPGSATGGGASDEASRPFEEEL